MVSLKGGQTSTFTVALTQSEQESITRKQIPICKVIGVKYDLNEYRVKIKESIESSKNTSISTPKPKTPTYSNSEIKRWIEARYEYYDEE